MKGFPKIPGIEWLCEDFPDLIAVDVTLVNRSRQEMDIPGMDLGEVPSKMYIDLTMLAGLNPWYPKGSDDPSETECSVDVNGISNFVANVKLEDFIQAWIFCKRFKYSRK